MVKDDKEIIYIILLGVLYIVGFNIFFFIMGYIMSYVNLVAMCFNIVVFILLWLERNKYKKKLYMDMSSDKKEEVAEDGYME